MRGLNRNLKFVHQFSTSDTKILCGIGRSPFAAVKLINGTCLRRSCCCKGRFYLVGRGGFATLSIVLDMFSKLQEYQSSKLLEFQCDRCFLSLFRMSGVRARSHIIVYS